MSFEFIQTFDIIKETYETDFHMITLAPITENPRLILIFAGFRNSSKSHFSKMFSCILREGEARAPYTQTQNRDQLKNSLSLKYSMVKLSKNQFVNNFKNPRSRLCFSCWRCSRGRSPSCTRCPAPGTSRTPSKHYIYDGGIFDNAKSLREAAKKVFF